MNEYGSGFPAESGSNDFEAIYIENGLLRGELAALMEESEYLAEVAIPRAQTSYTIKIEALHAEIMLLQAGIMKTRKRIAMVRESLQRGEPCNTAALSAEIDEEFADWDERLKRKLAKIDDAKARFSSLFPPEDEKEVRSIYRILSRKMNPEINPDRSEEAASFWPNIKEAYASRDLFQLKALLLMADDYPESYDLPSDIGSARAAGRILKEKIDRVNSNLRDIRRHPAFQWQSLLADPRRLAEEQARLRDEIEKVHMQSVALDDMLKSLELRNSRIK